MWELDHKAGWAPKSLCFWTVVLEKTLESLLDCREIQPVNPKGNQPWIFTGRTDAEAETPILWPPYVKNWLIWKDPDAGKDLRAGEGVMWPDATICRRCRPWSLPLPAQDPGLMRAQLMQCCWRPHGGSRAKHIQGPTVLLTGLPPTRSQEWPEGTLHRPAPTSPRLRSSALGPPDPSPRLPSPRSPWP